MTGFRKGTGMDDRIRVKALMKRCQIGVGGRAALEQAHEIMADCYGTLGRLLSERDAADARVRVLEVRLEQVERDLSARVAEVEAERTHVEDERDVLRAQVRDIATRALRHLEGPRTITQPQWYADREAFKAAIAADAPTGAMACVVAERDGLKDALALLREAAGALNRRIAAMPGAVLGGAR